MKDPVVCVPDQTEPGQKTECLIAGPDWPARIQLAKKAFVGVESSCELNPSSQEVVEYVFLLTDGLLNKTIKIVKINNKKM